MKIAITEDYPIEPIIEKKILKDYLLNKKDNFEATILLAWRKKIDKEYLSKFSQLKYIIRYGSGYDNIDLNYIKKKKIFLFNNPKYAYKDVAETAIALIFNFVRRINEYNQLANETSKNFDKDFLGFEDQYSLRNLKVGVIGSGKIGSEVCKKISPFVSKVFYFDKREIKFNKVFKNIYKKNLSYIIKNSNIISLHLDLNNKTKGLIDKKKLQLIKNPIIFINVSREELIDNYNDLYEALIENKLSHIGLDISFNNKNTLKSNLIKAWKSKNKKINNRIIINPHVAFYSKDSFIQMRTDAANMSLKIIKNNNTRINRVL